MTSKLSAAIQAELIVGGVTQSALAHKLGVSSTTVNHWIKGRKFPDRESLAELKSAFNWTRDDIIEMARDYILNDGGLKIYRLAHTAFVKSMFENDYEAFLDALLALDREELRVDEHHIGTSNQWAKIFDQGSDFWRVLVYDDEVVGYWQASVVREDVLERIIRGELLDSEITCEMLCHPVLPGNYSLYFCVLLLSREHRSAKNLQRLLKSFLGVLEDFARSGIFFDDIGTVAVSREGSQLCESLGMVKIRNLERRTEHEVFEVFRARGSIISTLRIPNSLGGKDLTDLYREHFTPEQKTGDCR
ncbi:hypothetical protein DSM14862_02131 [Sulfitobacter indolifex]|uniref:helix-turn-helix transcriptional regulator n=1 Tax=Sulfitobacter indolifex TaxID=225422 RepID=UPI00103B509D|nr:hypothetical protein [Sulfitobacter indolifex]UOA19336.1 hypothetical protein DSM14862_02131 [Sulfitobacter indolifex]